MSAARLRPASAADAAALACLVTQLAGQLSTADEVAARWERLDGHLSREVSVAELDGHVVGVAVGEVHRTLTRNEPVAKLALLVVHEDFRGRGIGRMLVRAFEQWALGQGARHASLTSASRRAEAHAFYRSCGWDVTGVRFGRELTN